MDNQEARFGGTQACWRGVIIEREMAKMRIKIRVSKHGDDRLVQIVCVLLQTQQ